MEIGERWAERPGKNKPLVEVEVLAIGTKTPPRVKVRYMADELEGRELWISPARLKAPWADAEFFLSRETRWDAVLYHANDGEAKLSAAEWILDWVIDYSVSEPYRGVGTRLIHDLPALSELLNMSADRLLGADLTIDEPAGLVVSWPITERMARTAASINPAVVVKKVTELELDDIRSRLRRHVREGRAKARAIEGEFSSSAADRLDVESAVTYGVMREWAGLQAVDLEREVRMLRGELARVTDVAGRAIEELRSQGGTMKARGTRLAKEILTGPLE
jgi:hypothetical protein